MATKAVYTKPSESRRKLAFIVGIENYENCPPLRNPVNDANAIAFVLENIDFIVTKLLNSTSLEFKNALSKFENEIQENDIVLFYFSGHGTQWDGQNYLIPQDISGLSVQDLKRKAINAQKALDSLSDMGPFAIIFLLDCCRSYPLVTSDGSKSLSRTPGTSSRGLQPMQKAGSLIAYACAPGTIASDGDEQSNGLFTKHLLEHIKSRDDILTILCNVTGGVRQESKDQQIPYLNVSLSEKIYLLEKELTPLIKSEPILNIMKIPDNDLELNDKIGRGAFGIVYRARWLSQHQDVAVKRLHLTQLDEQSEKTFFEELLILHKLRHPHIINLYGACLDPGKYSVLMEYMSLGSLYQVLHRDKLPLKWPDRLSIALQTAKGTNYLHNLQPPVFHRDIKSLNILLNPSHDGYIVKLCDFGLAKIRNETTRRSLMFQSLLCTLPWAAPERLAMKPYTAKSDVYSLGVVFWEIVTNEIPYGDSEADIICAFVLRGDRLEIPETTQPNFSSLIQKCWAHDPKDRPTCSQVIEAIQRCAQTRAGSTDPPLTCQRHNNMVDPSSPMPTTARFPVDSTTTITTSNHLQFPKHVPNIDSNPDFSKSSSDVKLTVLQQKFLNLFSQIHIEDEDQVTQLILIKKAEIQSLERKGRTNAALKRRDSLSKLEELQFFANEIARLEGSRPNIDLAGLKLKLENGLKELELQDSSQLTELIVATKAEIESLERKGRTNAALKRRDSLSKLEELQFFANEIARLEGSRPNIDLAGLKLKLENGLKELELQDSSQLTELIVATKAEIESLERKGRTNAALKRRDSLSKLEELQFFANEIARLEGSRPNIDLAGLKLKLENGLKELELQDSSQLTELIVATKAEIESLERKGRTNAALKRRDSLSKLEELQFFANEIARLEGSRPNIDLAGLKLKLENGLKELELQDSSQLTELIVATKAEIESLERKGRTNAALKRRDSLSKLEELQFFANEIARLEGSRPNIDLAGLKLKLENGLKELELQDSSQLTELIVARKAEIESLEREGRTNAALKRRDSLSKLEELQFFANEIARLEGSRPNIDLAGLKLKLENGLKELELQDSSQLTELIVARKAEIESLERKGRTNAALKRRDSLSKLEELQFFANEIARLEGSPPNIDLAGLKLKLENNLKELELNDTDELRKSILAKKQEIQTLEAAGKTNTAQKRRDSLSKLEKLQSLVDDIARLEGSRPNIDLADLELKLENGLKELELQDSSQLTELIVARKAEIESLERKGRTNAALKRRDSLSKLEELQFFANEIARLEGSPPNIDLAGLKLKLENNLKELELNDTDELRKSILAKKQEIQTLEAAGKTNTAQKRRDSLSKLEKLQSLVDDIARLEGSRPNIDLADLELKLENGLKELELKDTDELRKSILAKKQEIQTLEAAGKTNTAQKRRDSLSKLEELQSLADKIARMKWRNNSGGIRKVYELNIIRDCVQADPFHLEDLVQAGELQYFNKTLNDIAKNLIADLGHENCTFTEFIHRCLTPIMYLLKRQQNLDDFINTLTIEFQLQQQSINQKATEIVYISLRMLLHALLSKSDIFLRRVLVSLISKRNPVPFIVPTLHDTTGKENFEIVPAIIHVWNHTRPTILSLSVGPCQGKSTLLNELFQSKFEQTFKSIYFQQTIDVDFGYSFNPERLLNIADAHGTLNTKLLHKIIPLFDGFLIQINKDYLDREPKTIINYLEILPEEKFQMIILRDSSNLNQADLLHRLQELAKNSDSRLSQHMHVYVLPNISNTNDRNVKFAIEGLRKTILMKITHSIKKIHDIDEVQCHLLKLIDKDYVKYLTKMDNVIKPLKKRLLYTSDYKSDENYPLYLKFRELCKLRQQLKKLDFYGSESQKIFELNNALFELESELGTNTKRSSPIRCGHVFDSFVEILKSENMLMSLDLLASELKHALLNLGADKLAGGLAIERSLLSLEVLWRNAIVCYDHTTDETKEWIRKSYYHFVASGFPFEIIDGDNFHFQQQFLTEILKEFHSKRILVISIIGPQNSGKSTLLNYMFGTLFDVRDGRCTRGIYGSLVKIKKPNPAFQNLFGKNSPKNTSEIDYIMLIDTEGLLAVEKGDKEYDRRLVLFSLAVSHLVIVNMAGDISQTLQDMLTVCADSLKQIGVNTANQPIVHFVLNQKANPNVNNHMEAIQKVVEDLKDKKLAEVIDISPKTFHSLPSAFKKDRISNDTSSPCFLRTEPDFIERTQQLCEKIIQSAQESYERTKNIFSDPPQWVRIAINIFDTLQKFPDLTYFKDINERQQDNQIRQAIRDLITKKLSTDYRQQLIKDACHLTEDAIRRNFQLQFDVHQDEFDNELEGIFQVTAASDRIRERCKQFLKRQITETCNAWCTAAIQAHDRDREQMKSLVRDGAADLRSLIDAYIKSGKIMTKKAAEDNFEKMWHRKKSTIQESFKPEEQLAQAIKFVYGNYHIFEKESLPALQTILGYLEFIKELSRKDNFSMVLDSLKSNFKHFLTQTSQHSLEVSRKPADINSVYTLATLKNFKHLNGSILGDLYVAGGQQEEEFRHHHLQSNHDYPKQNIFIRLSKNVKNLGGFESFSEASSKISRNIKQQPLRFDFKQAVHDIILSEMSNQTTPESKIFNIIELFNTILEEVEPILRANGQTYRSIEIDLIQDVVGRINKYFHEANLELLVFKFSLSQQLKSHIHVFILMLMTTLYFGEQKKHFEEQISTLENEKESLLNYFISMVVPDAECDEEVGKVLAEKVLDAIKTSFLRDARKIITNETEKQNDLTRKRIQDICDGKLMAAGDDKEWLLLYITKPDEIIIGEFKKLWIGIEKAIDQQIDMRKKEYNVVLQEFFNRINSIHVILTSQDSMVTYIDDIFEASGGHAEENLKNKQQCMVLLLFEYLSGEQITSGKSYTVSNTSYILKSKGTNLFKNTLKPSDQLIYIVRGIRDGDEADNKRMLIALIKNLSVFLKSIIDARTNTENKYNRIPANFAELDKDQVYSKILDKVRGCTAKCPCCQRPCDVDHSVVKSNPGDADNRHACNTGHQLRAMAGTKFETTNEASLYQCEKMEDQQPIVVRGTKKKWSEFKNDHPDWNFSNSIKEDDFLHKRSKFLLVWGKIGRKLCHLYDMKFVTYNTKQPAPKPFHYMFLLDSSGSMGGKPWNDLIIGVKQFLDIRNESGSKDRISIITFNDNAKHFCTNKDISAVNLNEIKFPNGGTNFGNAFKLLTDTINDIENPNSNSNSTDRLDYVIIFMSNGEASYPDAELKALCDFKPKIHRFWTVALGSKRVEVLERINQTMEGSFRELTDSADLVRIYAEITRN